jgi:hypothetical protein
VPAIAEQYPGFYLTTWYAMVAPPRMPAAVAGKISKAVIEALKEPDAAKLPVAVDGRRRRLAGRDRRVHQAGGRTLARRHQSRRHQIRLKDWRGRDIKLPNGETRRFLADGDEVIFRARAQRAAMSQSASENAAAASNRRLAGLAIDRAAAARRYPAWLPTSLATVVAGARYIRQKPAIDAMFAFSA